MRPSSNRLLILTALVLAAGIAPLVAGDAGLHVGDPAPQFTLTDQDGNTVSLADSKGSVTVLEWVNPDCPFVKRHYQAGTMKALAESYAARGVVWLAVNSTHYMDTESNAAFDQAHHLPYPVLDDRDGSVGRSYSAATTPHLFIVDADGTLVYAGAIDDDPRGAKGDEATNYVARALDELLDGGTVSISETRSYGCSVKYKQ